MNNTLENLSKHMIKAYKGKEEQLQMFIEVILLAYCPNKIGEFPPPIPEDVD